MTMRPIAPQPAPGPAALPLPRSGASVPAENPAGALLASAGQWAKDEWSTTATALHAAASAPGMISKALEEAAADNRDLAHSMSSLRREWSHQSAPERSAALHDAQPAVQRLPGGKALSGKIAALNAAPAANAPKALPHDVAIALKKNARTFNRAAAAQAAQAGKQAKTVTGAISRALGTTIGDAASFGAVAKVVRAVPALRAVPVVGVGVAAAATIDDVRNHHVDAATAVAANAGSLVAGTVAGELTTGAVAGMLAEGAAGVGVGAAVVAAAPAEAIVAGAVVAVGVGYGVYKAVESKGGQDIIGGAVHGDVHRMQRGVAEAGADVRGAVDGLGSLARRMAGSIPR